MILAVDPLVITSYCCSSDTGHAERTLLDEATIEKNVAGVKEVLTRCLARENLPFKIMNNWEWYKDMHIITFLRDIGKHFKLNSMLSKDSVKLRQETNEV